MATDYSGLINLLSGGKSLQERAGFDPEKIREGLIREAAAPTDFLELFKSGLLAKAANMKALGSM